MAVTKQVPLSAPLLLLVEQRTKQLGVKFPEYIRHLILNDAEQSRDKINILGEESEELLLQSVRDIQKGDYKVLRNAREIKKYLTAEMNV